MAMELRGARGEGFATITADGRVLDSWFLRLSLVAETNKAATVRLTSGEINGTLGESADGYARHDDIRNVDMFPFIQKLTPLHLRRLMCTMHIFDSIY